jgi:hypothetical protein
VIDDLVRLINLGIIKIEGIKNLEVKAQVQAKLATV